MSEEPKKVYNINDTIISIEKYANTRDNGVLSDFVYMIRQSRVLSIRTYETTDSINRDYYTNRGMIRDDQVFDTIAEAENWINSKGMTAVELEGDLAKAYYQTGKLVVNKE